MTRHPAFWLSLVLIAAAPAALTACSKSTAYDAASAAAIPELPSKPDAWINGAATTFAAAKGNVVLVELWHRT